MAPSPGRRPPAPGRFCAWATWLPAPRSPHRAVHGRALPGPAKVSTSSGAWQGLAIDYLDRAEFQSYWRDNIEPLLADAKPYLGKTLRYLVTDSWELGGVNWTPQ